MTVPLLAMRSVSIDQPRFCVGILSAAGAECTAWEAGRICDQVIFQLRFAQVWTVGETLVTEISLILSGCCTCAQEAEAFLQLILHLTSTECCLFAMESRGLVCNGKQGTTVRTSRGQNAGACDILTKLDHKL